TLPSSGVHTNACLDTLARVRLMQGRLQESEHFLDVIGQSIQSQHDRTLHVHRYALLTRAQLRLRQGHQGDALTYIDELIELTAESRDYRLRLIASITKAEILSLMNDIQASMSVLETIVEDLRHYGPEMTAQYERALMAMLTVSGNERAASYLFEHAKQLCNDLGNAVGKMELIYSRQSAIEAHDRRHATARSDTVPNTPGSTSAMP